MDAVARTPAHIERVYTYIRRHPNDRAFHAKHGIKRISIFSRLDTISIPLSFPPDHMHIACNVARLMVDIYSGAAFGTVNDDPLDDGEQAPENRERPFVQQERTRVRRRHVGHARAPAGSDDEDGFASSGYEDDTGDEVVDELDHDGDGLDDDDSDNPGDPLDEDFIIPRVAWETIGKDQDRTRPTLPPSIGAIDNINKYAGEYLQASPLLPCSSIPGGHFGYLC
ncbi:MAG: hypothetical protein ACE3JU_15330 [Paenibacillus sp.]|uniref:hypothetical protein n=1 Tax=Paenibacillus sp. TaxID=58172 RepID=UPI003B75EA48